MRSLLRLVRAPNLFTAVSNVCSGFVLMAAVDDQLFTVVRYDRLAVLAMISACLYASGAVFNDLIDVEHDRRFRPDRPLASGAVSLRSALLLGSFLVAAALFAAMSLARNTVLIAGMIAAASWLYNGLTKRNMVLGALSMGLCRALNMVLGMSVGQSIIWLQPELVWAPALLGIYTFIVTLVSHYEDRPAGVSGPWVLFGAAAGLPLVLLGAVFNVVHTVTGWALLGLLILATGTLFVMTLMKVTFASVRRAVGISVVLIIVFDAAIVLGTRNAPFWLGLVVLGLVFPAALLARRMSPS